jgi:hypothetical protein
MVHPVYKYMTRILASSARGTEYVSFSLFSMYIPVYATTILAGVSKPAYSHHHTQSACIFCKLYIAAPPRRCIRYVYCNTNYAKCCTLQCTAVVTNSSQYRYITVHKKDRLLLYTRNVCVGDFLCFDVLCFGVLCFDINRVVTVRAKIMIIVTTVETHQQALFHDGRRLTI